MDQQQAARRGYMKAVLSREPGGPETLVLADAPEPTAGPGEVLLEVRACGVNFPDSLIIADKYQFRPKRPFAPGGEVAGVVAALGEGVTGLRVGDRVIGATGFSSHAFREHRERGARPAIPAKDNEAP